MVPKLIIVISLAVISFGVVFGIPRAFKSENDLKKSVVEFLSHDKEFLTALEKATSLDGQAGLLRHRRQTESMDIDNDDIAEEKEGFFDRAAKFVVDLLQRFLKWINSDSN